MRELHDEGEYQTEWIYHIRNTLNQRELNNLWNIPPDDLSPKGVSINVNSFMRIQPIPFLRPPPKKKNKSTHQHF